MKTYYRLIINRNSITNTGQGSVAGKDIFDICLKENEYFLGYTNSWELGEKDIQNLNLPKLKPGKSFVINGIRNRFVNMKLITIYISLRYLIIR